MLDQMWRCRRVYYPVRGDHCHLVVPLPWGGVQWCLGGWCVPSGIHMNATSQGFPEHCIVTRWSVLFASPLSVFNVVSDQHQWPSELGLDLCWISAGSAWSSSTSSLRETDKNSQIISYLHALTCLAHYAITHIFNRTAQKIWSITTVWRIVSPVQYPIKCELWSLPELWRLVMARKVLWQIIMVSQWSGPLTFWI